MVRRVGGAAGWPDRGAASAHDTREEPPAETQCPQSRTARTSKLVEEKKHLY